MGDSPDLSLVPVLRATAGLCPRSGERELNEIREFAESLTFLIISGSGMSLISRKIREVK